MKKIKNIFKSAILTIVLACSTLMTSCVDFLTIYPTDTVIHDKYWQTIDDVNGVLAASYLQLLSESAVQRYILWGEVRADNMIASLNTENAPPAPLPSARGRFLLFPKDSAASASSNRPRCACAP